MSDNTTDDDINYWSSLHNYIDEKKSKPSYKNYKEVHGIEIFFEDGDDQDAAVNVGEKKPVSVPIYNVKKNLNEEKDETSKLNSDLYVPENEYIVSCAICSWSVSLKLYNDFVSDAQKYYSKTCSHAEYVYFFSFRSQFKELNKSQLKWYLYWRSNVRVGVYPKTGLSYIFLYVYELINLCEIMGEEKAFNELIELWKAYRSTFPRIDRHLIEWIADFSFIHKLKIPTDILHSTLELNDLENIILPEIFIDRSFFSDYGNIQFLISKLSKYQYTSSKYYTFNTKKLFETHIPNIIFKAFEDCNEIKEFISKDGLKKKIIRESFSGAVCSYEKKKKITVEYINIFNNDILKKYITELIRSAENMIREHLKIKARLNQIDIPVGIRNFLKKYKEEHFPSAVTQKQKKNGSADYKAVKAKSNAEPEILYEFNASLEKAVNIEKRSWQTTETLVELQNKDVTNNYTDDVNGINDTNGKTNFVDSEFEELSLENTFTEELEELKETNEFYKNEYTEIIGSLTDEERELLKIFVESHESDDTNDTETSMKINNFSKKYNVLAEFTIESINGKAMDFLGDVILDIESNVIIDDYFEDLKTALEEINL